MNCPECGRFMALVFVGEDGAGYAYGWECTNDDCLQHDWGKPIPEHRYDWWYNCSIIPQEDLDEWPELAAECEAMRQKHGDAVPRPRYVYLLRAL